MRYKDRLGGKKTCKYYNTCGNADNCWRCKGYAKETQKSKQKKGE